MDAVTVGCSLEWSTYEYLLAPSHPRCKNNWLLLLLSIATTTTTIISSSIYVSSWRRIHRLCDGWRRRSPTRAAPLPCSPLSPPISRNDDMTLSLSLHTHTILARPSWTTTEEVPSLGLGLGLDGRQSKMSVFVLKWDIVWNGWVDVTRFLWLWTTPEIKQADRHSANITLSSSHEYCMHFVCSSRVIQQRTAFLSYSN